MENINKFKEYGESEQGNFKIIDTIGIPHPYCITPKHLEFNEGRMYLDVERAEQISKEKYPTNINKQAVCDICRKDGKEILTFKEHKQALVVECKTDIQNNKELKTYLLKIKDLAIKNKFEGFAFLDKR